VGVAYTAVEVADENDDLALILRPIYVERFQRDFFSVLVLDQDIASLCNRLRIRQVTVGLFPCFGNTHDLKKYVILEVLNMIEFCVFPIQYVDGAKKRKWGNSVVRDNVNKNSSWPVLIA
jgi:hypothetical protein